jgi:hypothetical protein
MKVRTNIKAGFPVNHRKGRGGFLRRRRGVRRQVPIQVPFRQLRTDGSQVPDVQRLRLDADGD